MQSLAAIAVFTGLALLPAPAGPGPEIGKPAPAFTLVDTYGKKHSLSDYKGKWVVLEWMNLDCPFVKKHYMSGNMQRLQKEYGAKGVVWLSIITGSQQYGQHEDLATPKQANAMTEKYGASPAAVLLDPKGTAMTAYDAQISPQMFVINPKGELLYDGAIDDKEMGTPDDVARAHNYVAAALDEAMAGKPVTTSKTKPYGCHPFNVEKGAHPTP